MNGFLCTINLMEENSSELSITHVVTNFKMCFFNMNILLALQRVSLVKLRIDDDDKGSCDVFAMRVSS